MPPMKARYGHTNLVALDWRKLAHFYTDLFGCLPVPPGGSAVGEVVTVDTADGRSVTWCYVTDLEGNIVELQAWSDRG